MSQSKASKILESIIGVSQIEGKQSGIQGILQTKDYNKFIILSDTGDELITFTGAKLASKCLPGDHVRWNGTACELELRDEHPYIVGTIELTNKSKYGFTSRGIPIYLFTPYSKHYPNFIVGCSEKDVSKNRIGLIKFDKWDTNSTFPRGKLEQTLGISGDYTAEFQAIIWQASPWKYPKHDYKPSKQINDKFEKITGYTFNIDPPGCKDVDDVLTFVHEEDGRWKIVISISNVQLYIEEGSVVDIMASLIGQTLYDNDGKVLKPMLPHEFSEEVCSLLPGKESYGISLEFYWNNGTISDKRWFLSTFVVDKSYTYDEFQESDSQYKRPLMEVASYLANSKEEVVDSHKWIEQMMIFYNTEAGKMLKETKMGILRRHSAPNVEKLEKYKEHVPDLEKLAFSSAEYCLAEDSETTHYGLNTTTYAHASSPIRRYADLVNQRVLKLILDMNGASKATYIVPQAIYDMNSREKAIKNFSRDLYFLNAINTAESTCSGIILGKTKDGEYLKIKIYVPEWHRTISTKYRTISNSNHVVSRDEKEEIDVSDFRKVTIKYAVNMTARCWKERIIVNIT